MLLEISSDSSFGVSCSFVSNAVFSFLFAFSCLIVVRRVSLRFPFFRHAKLSSHVSNNCHRTIFLASKFLFSSFPRFLFGPFFARVLLFLFHFDFGIPLSVFIIARIFYLSIPFFNFFQKILIFFRKNLYSVRTFL